MEDLEEGTNEDLAMKFINESYKNLNPESWKDEKEYDKKLFLAGLKAKDEKIQELIDKYENYNKEIEQWKKGMGLFPDAIHGSSVINDLKTLL